jgi:hypothetical protein
MSISELRLALRAAGYAPIPVIGKRVLLEGWPTLTNVSEEEVVSWGPRFPYWKSTGINTRDTPALDVDITHAEAANAVVELVRERFGDYGTLLVRTGLAPKQAILFRTDTPFSKIRVVFAAPDGSRHAVEMLGDGQQVVVNGIHEDTRRPYTWHGGYEPGAIPRSDLPEIDVEEAASLITSISEMLVEKFGYVEAQDEGNGAERGESKGPVDVEAELDAMQPGGAAANDVQCRIIGSLINAAEHPLDIVDKVVDATMAMAQRSELGWTRGMETKEVRRRVLHFLNERAKAADLTTGAPPPWLAGSFHERWTEILVSGGRPMWDRKRYFFLTGDVKEPPAGDKDQAEGPGVDQEPGKKRESRVVLKPFVPINEADLPPREWLYAKHYQRRIVSATVAPGGTGKTSLVMVEAVAMATGRNLLGEQPETRSRVWLHNGEDSHDELMRRAVAICKHYKIPQEELQGYLSLTSGNEMPLKVAHGYSDLKLDRVLIADITRTIVDGAIDAVMFDPLITLHNVREGDNNGMDTVVRIFTRIADSCDCSIDVSHHVRKQPSGSFDQDFVVDDARGAGAIRDAVRAMRLLNIMSRSDATSLGLDEFERLSYFRIDRGKANTVAPASSATWRKFESVDLLNGDDVGVVTAWQMPTKCSPEDQASDEQLFLQILDQFTKAERLANNTKHSNYAPKLFAKDPAAKAAKVPQRRLEEAMHRLLSSGRVRLEEYGRSDRPSHRLVRGSE